MLKFFIYISVGIFSYASASQIPNTILTIATGAINNGTYFEMGTKLCNLIKDSNNDKIKCIVRSTSGSLENIAVVLNDDTAMGLVQLDDLINHPRKDELKILSYLFDESITIIASNNSDAQSFNDILIQKVVNVPKSNNTILTLIKEKGWDRNDFINVGRYDITSLICKNNIDVAFFVSVNPNNFISNILNKCNAKLIGIEEEFINKIVKEKPSFKPYTIDGEIYGLRYGKVRTLAVPSVLVVSNNAPKDLVFNLLAIFFKNNAIKESHILLTNYKIEDFFPQKTIMPFHPEVIKFLNGNKEK